MRKNKWSKAAGLERHWLAYLMPHLIALSLMILATSCVRHTPETTDVIVALSAAPSTLDPRFATDATGSRIAGLLYSSLVRIGPDLQATAEAADSWKQTGRTYQFELKKNISFSDGHKLTPEDVDASFETFMTAKSAFASSFKVIESVHSVIVSNHIQTTVVLSMPSATFLADLISLKLLEKNESSLPPLGSGPFTLESQSANDIVLKARTDHPYAKPKISGVDFKIVRDDNTRVLKMLKGELDLAQAEFPAMKIAQLEKSDQLMVYKYPGLSLTYLLINLKDAYLSNHDVRSAMSQAIDRKSIVTYKLDGLATEATSLLTPNNPYFEKTLAPTEHSLEAAKRIVKDHPSPDLILKTSSAPAAVENGRILANDLQKAGFRVRVQSFEWGTFYGDVQSGRFQLATLRWVGTIDPDLYRKALHSKERPPIGRNRGSYENADVDRWTEEALKTDDFNQRKQIYSKVQKKVFEDLPFIPLWYDTEVAVVNKRLHDYQPSPDGSFWILTKVEKE
jgi:peptide/nickel transport system substrate-binding protein